MSTPKSPAGRRTIILGPVAVAALEEQYDAYLASRGEDSGDGDLLAGRRGFPTADELGAELERFLADQSKGGDQPEA